MRAVADDVLCSRVELVMPMKTKLEAIANVVVIVVALAVGYVVLGKYVSEYRARPVAAGDRLATIPNLEWKQHRHTLVLALNTGCHFCEQSVPFYRSLGEKLEHGGIDLDLVAVFPNDPAQVWQFMSKESLRVRSVAAVPLEKLRVVVTPTLIIVDADGRVERSWIGALTAPEELDVLKVASASEGCSPDELPALQAGKREGCNSGSRVQSKN